jgi:F0F1-type ATP synthase membrane subunit c/vacuolar-type H+-ATPase subunit K
MEPITSSFSKLFAKERRPLILLSFIVIVGSILVGTLSPPDPTLAQEVEAMTQDVEAGGYMMIFFNNAMITVTFLVPLLGLGSALMASFTTGAALSAIAEQAGANPQTLFLLTVIMPHSLIEFFAYSLVLSENVVIIQKILSRKGINDEVIPLVMSLVLALALLTIAMVVEVLTGQLLTGLISPM